MMKQVFIVDDDPAVLDSLALMIEQEGIAVQAFGSAEAFLAAGLGAEIACLIADIRMPGMDGMQLQKVLTEQGTMLPVIFLTGHGDIPMSVRAIKAGAVDFLTKPVTREKLLSSVLAALQEAEQRLEHDRQAMQRLAHLTERELEVMKLAVMGHANKEIARRLGISHRTVEIHKSKLMHKTGAASLLDLAHIAQECGLKSI